MSLINVKSFFGCNPMTQHHMIEKNIQPFYTQGNKGLLHSNSYLSTYPPTPTYLPIYQLLPTHPLLHTYLSTNSHLPTHSYLPTYLPDLWLFPCLQMQQQFTQYEFLFLNWFATRRGTPWWMDGWMDGWWVDRKILFHLGSQLPIIIGHLYYAPRLVVPRSYVPRDYRSLPGEMVYPLGT
jgi:hypothetical protein